MRLSVHYQVNVSDHESNVNSVYSEGLIYGFMLYYTIKGSVSSLPESENENGRKTLRPECQSDE